MPYSFDWSVLWEYRALLLAGLVTTVWISAVSLVLSTLLGVLLGVLGAVPGRGVRIAVAAYVEAMRNVPVVVKIFFLYFALNLDAHEAAITGVTIHQGAYITEIVRASLRAIPTHQVEGALSSGLPWPRIVRWVLLPQALPIALPAMTSQYIELVKNSSVVMTVGIMELTFYTQEIDLKTLRGFEVATAVTIGYMALALILSGAMHLVERVSRPVR